jgi:hypothetical protein
MSNEIAKREEQPVTQWFSSESSIATIKEAADLLASSNCVPDTFKNSPGDCIIALNMAERMGADVLAVMQSMAIVHGKPTFSASFLISCFNTCGRFRSIEYVFSGEGDDFGCTAQAVEIATDQVHTGTTITLGMAKAEGWFDKRGSKWKTMPEQMMRYRAATFLIRSLAPELSHGMHTSDEVADINAARVRPVALQPVNPFTSVADEDTERPATLLEKIADCESVDALRALWKANPEMSKEAQDAFDKKAAEFKE